MNQASDYIRNLICFGLIDSELHEKEQAYIMAIGMKLGLDRAFLEQELRHRGGLPPALPEDELTRFKLLYDILYLMTIDDSIDKEEVEECKRLAVQLGFDADVISILTQKLETHIKLGFRGNELPQLIRKELVSINPKFKTIEKYN